MNRKVQVGALVLILGGWVTNLVAQEASWRPVLRPPVDGSLPQPVSQPLQSASLDRPVPITRAVAPDSDQPERLERPTPAAIARPAPREDEPSVVRIGQGNVIASSAPPAQPVQMTSPVLTTQSVPPGLTPVAASSSEPSGEQVGGGEEFAAARQGASSPVSLAPPMIIPNGNQGEMVPPPVSNGAGPLGVPAPSQYAGTPAPSAQGGPPKNWQKTYPLDPPVFPTDYPGPAAPPPPRPTRGYLGAEYLLWWTKGDRIPPLVTTSSNPADNGFLSGPTTSVLSGGSLYQNARSGGRFTAGYWLDDQHSTAIEVTGFFLGQASNNATFNSSEFPVLARPFQIANTGAESAELVGFPGAFNGKVSINAPSNLWGVAANLRCPVCCCPSCGPGMPLQVFGGFRYLNLHESLTITEDVVGLANASPPLANTTSVVFDSFDTRNQFYGGQLGAEKRWLWGRFNLDLIGSVALGVTNQQLNINGGQTITNNTTGATQNFQGGLLALPGANIGSFSRSRFSVVPEAGVKVGYLILPNLRATVGYNFLYWSNVIRPGEQIDRSLDVTKIPNFTPPAGVTGPTATTHPAVLFKETDFWAQGLTVGLELYW